MCHVGFAVLSTGCAKGARQDRDSPVRLIAATGAPLCATSGCKPDPVPLGELTEDMMGMFMDLEDVMHRVCGALEAV